TSMATGTPLPPLRSFRRHIPGRYESVVQKALAIRPEDRYQSVAEMYQALFNEKLATSSTVEGHRQGGSGKPTTRRSTGRPRTIVKTIRRPPVAIALLSVGWLLAAVVWLILSGRGMSADRVAEQFTPAALTTVAQVSPASVTDDPVLTLTPTVEPTVVEPPSDANNTFALDAGMTPAATAVMVSTAIATIMATATSRSIAGTVTTETATKPAPTATQSSATRRPTSTPLATDTPRPLPTATATRPQPTAGPTVATPSGASVANPELVGTVALLSPVAGTTLNGGPRVPFEWTALAGGLPSNTLYELVFWPPGQDGLVAGLSPVGASEVTRVLVDLEVADRVLGDVVDARTNICWGVRLWDTAANRPVTMLTEGCRRFVYAGSPGGGASAVNTPWSGKN
ncbi:MAG: hypothetical protein KDE47_11700, partial [Caldilineaceae bacterium]|nr:hypothetical protein [Caldilineaceae bacterium]